MTPENAAKQLYWDYRCNHFGLHHDGKLDEYRRLGGGCPEKEAEWRREYIAYWLSRVSTMDLTAVRRLDEVRAHETIKHLLDITDYGDDYSKFWFAFSLAGLARCPKADSEDEVKAMHKAKTLWEEVVFRPVGISPQHRLEVSKDILAFCNASSVEEYVHNYARRKLGLRQIKNTSQ